MEDRDKRNLNENSFNQETLDASSIIAITDQKGSANKEVIESLSKVLKQVDNLIILTNAAGEIEWVNEGFTALTGYSLTEVAGKKPGSILEGAETGDESREEIMKGLSSKEPFTFEVANYTKQGKLFNLSLSITPVFNDDGQLENFIGLGTDITERVLIERTLKDREREFRELYENSVDEITLVEPISMKIVNVNRAVCEDTGYTKDELIGKRLSKVVSLTELTKNAFRVKNVINGKTELFITKQKRKDGSVFPVEIKLKTIQHEGKKTIIGMARDISERKKMELELHESQRQLTLINGNSPDLITTVDSSNIITYINRVEPGFSIKDIIGSDILHYVPAEFKAQYKKHLRSAFNGTPQNFEMIGNGVNKKSAWYKVRMSKLAEKEEVRSLLIISTDITKRKNAERELLNKTELAKGVPRFLQQVLDAAGAEGGSTYFENLTKLICESLQVKIAFVGEYDPDKHEVSTISFAIEGVKQDNFKYALKNTPCNNVVGREVCAYRSNVQQLFSKDKDLKTLGVESYLGAPLFDKDQQPIGLIVIMDDKPIKDMESSESLLRIVVKRTETELTRKKGEERLKIQQERLTLATGSANMGVWDWDVENDILSWDEPMYALYGVKKSDFTGAYDAWSSGIHPDDKAQSQKEVEAALKREKDFDAEFRVLMPDNSIRHIKGNAVVLRNDKDEPIRMIGVNWDITDTKNMENQLRNMLENREALVKARTSELQKTATDLETARHEMQQQIETVNNAAIVSEADVEGNITFANNKFCEISGYSIDELIGQNHRIIKSGKQPDAIFKGMWKAIKMGRVWRGELLNRKKGDLGHYWVDATVMPFKDIDGNITKFVAVRFDITEQKELQELLKNQAAQLATKAKALRASQNEIQRSHDELQKIHKDFQSSLQYAQRIQEASIPSKIELKKAFSDHFTLFKPRDVVSGDFYWLYRDENEVIIAMADCTGHGVPGAMMSMAGQEQLNNIVVRRNIRRPDIILEEMDKAIASLLQRKDARFSMNDGMDMSIVHVDHKNRVVSYSGAQSHCLYKKAEQFTELKPDKYSIGGGIMGGKLKEFTRQRFVLEKGDRFYLYSDGMYDQFGGSEGRKMMRKQFNRLLIESAELSMDEQHDFLEKTVTEWIGAESQVDDITVLGFEL